MATGFCTVDDVRRVFQDSQFSGALEENSNELVQFQIEAVSATVEKATKRHWYDSGGISEDSQGVIASGAESRSDEYDLPSHGGEVIGAAEPTGISPESRTVFSTGPTNPQVKERIRIAMGDLDDEDTPTYTRIRLTRKDVDSVDELNVVTKDGTVVDWVASNDYTGGVGLSNRGDDYWVQVNSGGVSELYLDVRNLDDDIMSLSNAVYAKISYGNDGIPQRIRRGVAHLVATDLVFDDEFVTAIPDSGQLVNIETKGDRWARTGLQKLQQDVEDMAILDAYR